MRKILLLLTICYIISAYCCIAQENESLEQVVYLIGNTATREMNIAHLSELNEHLQAERSPFTIIHLGDILQPELPESSPSGINHFFDLVNGNSKGRILFTSGDKDWNNSGRDGLRMVRKLEKEIEIHQQGSNIFLPSDGCPGPEIIDLSPNLRLIAINTQWWLHPFDIPEAPDSDCSNLTKEEFIESLEEAIEESDGKNILIIGHHPIISAGVYGGHMTFQKHMFPFADANPNNRIPVPILGSFYAAYRQNVGTVRDMANEDYQELVNNMSDILTQHPGLVYASAHDYSLQLLEKEKGYQIVSGSINEKEPTGNEQGVLFSGSEYGFTKIEYYKSGKIKIGFFEIGNNEPTKLYSEILFRSACEDAADNNIPINRYYIPCMEEDENQVIQKTPFPAGPVTVTAGTYKANGIKRMFLGSLYRETWMTPVSISYLNLDTTKSGLKPFALGGGRQTTTLKFLANNGKEYAFRSVDKNLVNALPMEFRNTLVSVMIKEVTATEYPYGAIIVSALLDETEILHARPSLYVLPDHPGLGAFREPLSGLFGMLEDRPTDPNEQIQGFMGADDVTRSVGLYRKLYRDNDYYVNAKMLGRARVVDMFVGDWGRHEDNWKWAGFDKGNKRVYYPIPRDRDHAFCKWNGLLPYIADREWAMPMVESFDYDFHDIKSLTWPARHVDRSLLTELDRRDWMRISEEIQLAMTDEVIDKAISTLPSEVIPVSGIEIGEKLKSRRTQLPDAVDEFYMLLARQVDVVGSNKHEYIEVDRLPSGNVQVNMYKRKLDGSIHFDDPMYSRNFHRDETREICIYGLDGNDIFNLTGSSNKSILIRVIGGPGNDEINDSSVVTGPSKHTIIYDNKSTLLNLGSESKSKTSDDPGINKYDRKAFKYNTYFPKPLIFYSRDDGLVASFGLNWTTHGFRKHDYKSNHDIYIRAGTLGNIQFGTKNHWKDVMGNWNVGINADFGRNYPYYNFFGLGNNTVKDPELHDADYYKVNVKGLMTNLYTENKIFRKGLFRMGLLFENFDSDVLSDSSLLHNWNTIPGSDMLTLGGINTRFYLDFRDRNLFATRGLQFLAENTSYITLLGESGNFGLAESYLKFYATTELLIPITLVVKLGGSINYGQQIPFYKFTYLGQFNNLRGYLRNRFTGDASAYVNTEMRFHLGKVRNPFLPFETGLIGFYDIGKVWIESRAEGGWHAGYGGGFYVSPLTRDYLFTVLLESSVEEKMLFRFGIGFMLDR
ncbi:hypothetical protein ACFLTA_05115 [Bacteroidota bacterium]